MNWKINTGHVLDVLADLKPESVQTCVTSPPYWGLRDYGDTGQEWPAVTFCPVAGLPSLTIPAQRVALGREPDPWQYVAHLVQVFRSVRRVLRDDGTLWLNLGDSFQDKHLQGIPWRVAFALQADGWYLRSDIIWAKPNPMPTSASDRCTTAHEYIYLLTKQPRYYYDADAIAEDSIHAGKVITLGPKSLSKAQATGMGVKPGGNALLESMTVTDKRNARSVWTITTRSFPDTHFATFPPDLPQRCIKAGSRPGDLVLDPFSGAGTTGMVARRLQRSYVGIEQSSEYADMSRRRIDADAPLFNRKQKDTV